MYSVCKVITLLIKSIVKLKEIDIKDKTIKAAKNEERSKNTNTKSIKKTPPNKILDGQYAQRLVDWFYDISTCVGYLTPNPFLCK